MASISLTLLDTQNGIIVSTFNISDKDILKVYSHYAKELGDSFNADRNNPDFEPADIPMASSNDICDFLAGKIIKMIATDVYNQEARECVLRNISYIDVVNIRDKK